MLRWSLLVVALVVALSFFGMLQVGGAPFEYRQCLAAGVSASRCELLLR